MSKRLDTIKELQREQRERMNKYPQLIQKGKLNRERANRQYQLVNHLIMVLHAISDAEYHVMEQVGRDTMTRNNGQQSSLF